MIDEAVRQLESQWSDDERWSGIERTYTAEQVVAPARLRRPRAHAREARRGAALGAAPARRARPRARRADRRPGRADGARRPRGDLPLRLAGRRRREPRRLDVSRPEPLSGQQRPVARPAPQQRAPARRPDRLGRGPERDALARADRRRRRGRLRRAAQRVRADEGDDRGGRRGRPLRGSALLREEVRPPRRQGARPDAAVRPHAQRGAPRGRRLRRADGARRAHRRARPPRSSRATSTSTTATSSPASARRRASSGSATGIEAAISRGLAYAPYADLVWFETSTPDLGEAKEFAEAIHEKFPGKLLAYNCSPSFNWRKHLDDDQIASFQDSSTSGATASSSSRSPASTRSTRRCSSSRAATPTEQMPAYVRLQEREFELEEFGYTATRHQHEVGAGYFDLVTQAVSPESETLALKGSTEEAQFTKEPRERASPRRRCRARARVRRAAPPRAQPAAARAARARGRSGRLRLDAGEQPELPRRDARDPRGDWSVAPAPRRPRRPPRARSPARSTGR